jgi:preprotein translocase subunit YajC
VCLSARQRRVARQNCRAQAAPAYNAKLPIFCTSLCKSGRFVLFSRFTILELPVFISSAFAQTAPAAAAEGGMQSTLMSMLPLVLMFVVLYFVMIRPQMKKQKEHRSMIEALAKGDEVATGGGLLGKVTKLGDSYMTLEVASGVEVQVQRSAVIQVLPKGSLSIK